ncbi:uncharacterized protein F5891DRAFT_1192443 [Suillus fuscotomentosus]|uniref:Uncharacterized protein n=1 Tax=Suillus fuscotomentosus TaxID=1912939 RepID=A0AAD4HHQ2_9AGAM|nr:uncharacterized protein F5891DRAFT_1192443 [Suillus fuscotomentosus]KAG1897028.1 hypothetical protein F5891DRAFT_1192443 [Suillus fuscotomentosus]
MPTSLTLPLRAQSAYYDCSQAWKSQPSTPQQKRYSLASGPPLVKHHSTPSANHLAIQSSTDTCAQFETSLQISTLREPSAQEINKGVWRKKIVAEIRGQRHGVHDSQSFSHVSINDYEYIAEAIAGDDDWYNLSYTPSSSQLVVILPSPIHENFLMPLRKSMDAAFASMGIAPEYSEFMIQMNSTLNGCGTSGSQAKPLSQPDILVEFHDKESGWLQLWGTEVSYSETRQDVLYKLQDYIDGAPNIVALTLFDIKENVRHSPPKESSRMFDTLNEVELVVPFHKWIRKSNKSFPGPVTVFRHNWVSAVTVTVTMWLRCPTGQLNLNDHDNEFYQYAELTPNTDSTGLANVQCLFQHTMLRIRDTTLDHIDQLAAEDAVEESSSDESSSDGSSSDRSSSDGSSSDGSNSDDHRGPFTTGLSHMGSSGNALRLGDADALLTEWVEADRIRSIFLLA